MGAPERDEPAKPDFVARWFDREEPDVEPAADVEPTRVRDPLTDSLTEPLADPLGDPLTDPWHDSPEAAQPMAAAEPVVEPEPVDDAGPVETTHEAEPEAPRTARFETLEELLAAATARSENASAEPAEHADPADPAPEPAHTPPLITPFAQATAPTVAPARRDPVETDRQESSRLHDGSTHAGSTASLAEGNPDEQCEGAEVIDLSPAPGGRTSTQGLLAAGALAIVVLAWLAWQTRSPISIVLLVLVAVATLVMWAKHSGPTPRVVVERGDLDIRSHDSHHRFALRGNTANYETVGTPGQRGWKVLIHRTGMPPYVVDARLVDADEFARVIERYGAVQPADPGTAIQ